MEVKQTVLEQTLLPPLPIHNIIQSVETTDGILDMVSEATEKLFTDPLIGKIDLYKKQEPDLLANKIDLYEKTNPVEDKNKTTIDKINEFSNVVEIQKIKEDGIIIEDRQIEHEIKKLEELKENIDSVLEETKEKIKDEKR